MNASELLFGGLLVAMFLLLPGARRVSARRAAVAAGASVALALAVAQVVSRLVDRQRPFVDDPSGVHTFARHAPDPGFPSDHATAAFAIAVAIFLRDRRWGTVALAFATLLAVGRVAIGVHYPSDVIAGAALGALSAVFLWWAPLRMRLHALAGWAGGLLDAAARRVVGVRG